MISAERTVWPEDRALVRNYLGVTEECLRSDVEALKHWLGRQPHLAGCLKGVDEDKWLENYLMMNKNSVERAKTNLESYFRLRWILPEMFQDRDMSGKRMQNSFENTCVAFMPGLTEEGFRVVVYSHFTDDATHFHPQDLAKRLFAIADICLDEGIDRVSSVIILDLKNTRLNHLARYNLALLKNIFDHGWKAYPERVAAVHIINPPQVMDAALSVFKPFLKQKIRDRIQIHSDVSCLKEHIPLRCIPSEYGGLGPACSVMNRLWQDKMVECKTLLEVTATHRSQEHLRPEGSKSVGPWSDLGVEGTFRKLTVD